jgi:ribonuclease P protein component
MVTSFYLYLGKLRQKDNTRKMKLPEVEKIKDFKAFFGLARKRKSQAFSLYYVKGEQDKKTELVSSKAGSLSFGVIASKKGVSKKAVHRNRVKRRLRSAFRDALKSTDLPSNREIQLVFFANRCLLEAKWKNLTESVTHAMQVVLEDGQK